MITYRCSWFSGQRHLTSFCWVFWMLYNYHWFHHIDLTLDRENFNFKFQSPGGAKLKNRKPLAWCGPYLLLSKLSQFVVIWQTFRFSMKSTGPHHLPKPARMKCSKCQSWKPARVWGQPKLPTQGFDRKETQNYPLWCQHITLIIITTTNI